MWHGIFNETFFCDFRTSCFLGVNVKRKLYFFCDFYPRCGSALILGKLNVFFVLRQSFQCQMTEKSESFSERFFCQLVFRLLNFFSHFLPFLFILPCRIFAQIIYFMTEKKVEMHKDVRNSAF